MRTNSFNLSMVLLVAALSCRREAPSVTVTSEPAGAVVWADDTIVGPTPVRLPRTGSAPVTVTVTMPMYEEWTATLSPGSGIDHLHAALKRQGAISIRCVSDPPGAEIFINGEPRGHAPLVLEGFEPGTLELVARADKREQITRTLVLTPEQPLLVVEIHLPSREAAFYRSAIEREPGNLHNYVDLGHHYILAQRIDAAMDVFRTAIPVALANPNGEGPQRLWAEIQRVLEEQYEYGDAATVGQARVATRDLLAEMLEKYPRQNVQLHIGYVMALDYLNDRQAARAALTRALSLFPGDRALQRLRQQRNL